MGLSVSNTAWTVTASNKFLYDGWNLVAELNATNSAVIRTYAWAGGVGGLLWVSGQSRYEFRKQRRRMLPAGECRGESSPSQGSRFESMKRSAPRFGSWEGGAVKQPHVSAFGKTVPIAKSRTVRPLSRDGRAECGCVALRLTALRPQTAPAFARRRGTGERPRRFSPSPSRFR